MIKSNRVRTVLLAVFMMVFFAVSANAAWYTCSIDMVGSAHNLVLIRLSDTNSEPAFNRVWFVIASDKSDQMLATGLTAVNMGKKVMVRVDDTVHYSDILAVYLIP